jgi:predicted extracellular nuclease
MRNASLALMAALLAAVAIAPAAFAVSPDIVISQVYGGGGNSGAPYTNDFVELFNLGTTPVSITGWSIQYASATGTGSFGGNPVTLLSGVLAPGQYYLVQMAGGASGVPLPTPDAIGTVSMSGTGAKVVLVNSSSGLACNGGSTPCSPADLAQIVDLVGWGAANFYEGAGAAPGTSNTTSASRMSGGCIDTDDNAADFTAGAPNPRNTSSPVNLCSTTGARGSSWGRLKLHYR